MTTWGASVAERFAAGLHANQDAIIDAAAAVAAAAETHAELPRTRLGRLDWATFLAGLWAYVTAGVAAALAVVLTLLGIRRILR